MTNGEREQPMIALTERQRELMIALTQRQKELEGALRSLDSIAVEILPDAVDQGQSNLEREWSIRTLSTTSQLLRAVADALERLRTGGYGICEECGEPINPRRLQALPWAARCVTCQEQADEQPGNQDEPVWIPSVPAA